MEQRKTQRYRMQLPMEILLLGGRPIRRTEQTRDISSGGVCFSSNQGLDLGGRVEYVITLSGANPPVKIRCLGKVLRSQRTLAEIPDSPFHIAITMERYSFVRPGEFESLAMAGSSPVATQIL